MRGISLPFESRPGDILKAHIILAELMKTERSATCRPAQILITEKVSQRCNCRSTRSHRRPNPNWTTGMSLLMIFLPFFSMIHRAGWNASGFENSSGSRSIDLTLKLVEATFEEAMRNAPMVPGNDGAFRDDHVFLQVKVCEPLKLSISWNGLHM